MGSQNITKKNDLALYRITISSESDMSIKLKGSISSALINRQPEVFTRPLANVHHAADPEI
jgi:hypothetical protein